MSVEEKVIKIGKKLDKMIANKTTDHSSTVDILTGLQDIPMNLEALQKTKIGMTVNNVRKSTTNEEAVNIAKNLIKNWKRLLPGNSKSDPEKKTKCDEVGENPGPASVKKKAVHSKAQKKEVKKRVTDTPDAKCSVTPDTTDSIRLKCRELLCEAIEPDAASPCYIDHVELARLVEEKIYEEFKVTDSKYKNRVRSRVANLKNKNHPDLKENVLRGLITPERLARMTAEEMASDDMKDLRTRYTEEAINDYQLPKVDGAVSDLFSCEKCGAKNCTYKQVQLLCSDEPMTTFLLCYTCGHRWSFV